MPPCPRIHLSAHFLPATPRGPSLLSPIPHAADRRPPFGLDSRKCGVRSDDVLTVQARHLRGWGKGRRPPESKGQWKPSLPLPQPPREGLLGLARG